jgi:hypothetical protein
MVRTLTATRYVTPLRQGSSLPAIVEADDGALYVMKFVGAGQGGKALIADLLAGEIGRALGLPVPELVLLELPAELGRSEPDPEIHDLLQASVGVNLGMRFLPNAFGYDALLGPPPSADLASRVVWFDAYVTNVDRTPANVNILVWHGDLWLIDHGAALYFHYRWMNHQEHSRTSFPRIRDHVLIRHASALDQADAALRPIMTDELIADLVALIPESWLTRPPASDRPEAQRRIYADYLRGRRDAAAGFVREAADAHARAV